jgi:hypothetical protein
VSHSVSAVVLGLDDLKVTDSIANRLGILIVVRVSDDLDVPIEGMLFLITDAVDAADDLFRLRQIRAERNN